MSWATQHITRLKQGETLRFRPSGHSMTGKVNHRDLVEVGPVTADTVLVVGEIVLCRVNGRDYLHLIKQIDQQGRVLIGNNRGGVNGWTSRDKVFGLLLRNLGTSS